MMIRQFLLSTIVALASLSCCLTALPVYSVESDDVEMDVGNCVESPGEEELNKQAEEELYAFLELREKDRKRLLSLGACVDWSEWKVMWDNLIDKRRSAVLRYKVSQEQGEVSIATILAGICLRIKAFVNEQRVAGLVCLRPFVKGDLRFLHNIFGELNLVVRKVQNAPSSEFDWSLASIKESIDSLGESVANFKELSLIYQARSYVDSIEFAINEIRRCILL